MTLVDEIRHEVATGEFVEQKVTYFLETENGIVIVENVPARVSVQTGERLFAPAVVEQLQELIWRRNIP